MPGHIIITMSVEVYYINVQNIMFSVTGIRIEACRTCIVYCDADILLIGHSNLLDGVEIGTVVFV
jgi:hypothetical protein